MCGKDQNAAERKEMMSRNLLIVLVGFLIAVLPSACSKKEKVEQKSVVTTLEVIADFDDAEVLIQGKRYSVNREIQLPAGEYIVIVEKAGHQSVWEKVELKANEKKKIITDFQVNKTTVLFMTSDEGVKITLKKGDEIIQSGASPLYVTDLIPGDYTYIAEKQGYTTQISPLTIDDSGMAKKVQIQLDNTIGYLELKLIPSDAVVYVNGVEKAYNGRPLKLSAGNYEVRVAKKGFEDQNGTVEIQKQKISVLNFNLRQKKAKLSVKVEGHPDAIVKINGEVVNSPEKWQEVDAGKYKIEVTKDFYDKEEVEINLDPEQEEQVVISKLNRNTGSVRLKLDHPAVQISLNGKVIGMSQPAADGGAEDFVVEGLAIGGKYRFTFEHPNQFKTVARAVTITKENKNVQLKVPFTVANATIKYKEGANRKAGKVYVKELSDTELEVTFPTTSGKGAYSEKIRKDEVIIDYLPPVSVDAEYKSSSYDLLKAAGK